jgi:hypothetical protein
LAAGAAGGGVADALWPRFGLGRGRGGRAVLALDGGGAGFTGADGFTGGGEAAGATAPGA